MTILPFYAGFGGGGGGLRQGRGAIRQRGLLGGHPCTE